MKTDQHSVTSFYARIVKRILDVLLSCVAIVVLSPLLLCLMAAVKLDSEGPVFFRQKRIGKGQTCFEMYKFRTMRIDTPHDVPTHLLENPDQWITSVGRFLRKTSLDELPQLFNILRGEMSFVGPRPALWNQDDLIAAREECGANAVRPGLTGWAQINGRDELPIAVKAELDGFYASRISFLFDLRCFGGTFSYVLHRKGVVEGGTGQIEPSSDPANTDTEASDTQEGK